MFGITMAGWTRPETRLFALVPFALLSLLSITPSVQAQVASNPTGFHLGARLNGSAIQYENDDDTESGGGLGLALGYGFNRTVTLYAEGVGASVQMVDLSDTYTLAHFDLGVRLNLGGEARSTLGFVSLGLSGRAAGLDLQGDPFTIVGAGFTVGGGVAFFLNPSASIDLGLKWTGGSFTEAEYRGRTESIDVSATSARFDVGFSWWAGR